MLSKMVPHSVLWSSCGLPCTSAFWWKLTLESFSIQVICENIGLTLLHFVLSLWEQFGFVLWPLTGDLSRVFTAAHPDILDRIHGDSNNDNGWIYGSSSISRLNFVQYQSTVKSLNVPKYQDAKFKMNYIQRAFLQSFVGSNAKKTSPKKQPLAAV